MVLKGDLKSISLVSLLQMIEGERKSGYLAVESGRFTRRLFLSEGRILSLVSNDPHDLFGHFLISRGFITEKQLAEALGRQSQTQGLLGGILAAMTKMSEAKIQEQLLQKLQESFYHLFLLEDAGFEFHEEAIDLSQFPSVTPLGIQSLLMEGTRRLDEYKRLKKMFPNSYQQFKVHRDKMGAELSQKGSIAKLIDLLEAGATIDDLCMNFHTYDYTIFHYLEPLFNRGIISKGEVRKPSTQEVQLKATGVLMELAQKAEAAQDWANAVEVYGDLVKLEPTNKAFVDKLKFVQAKFADKALSSNLKRDAVLKLNATCDFNAVKLSAQEGFVLSRVNGQWKVSEILSVVPMPEAEVLAILQRLLDQKVLLDR